MAPSPIRKPCHGSRKILQNVGPSAAGGLRSVECNNQHQDQGKHQGNHQKATPGRLLGTAVRPAAFLPRSPPRTRPSRKPRSVPAEVPRAAPVEASSRASPVEASSSAPGSGLLNGGPPPVTPERRTPIPIGDGVSPITLCAADFPGPAAGDRSRPPPALPDAKGFEDSPPPMPWGLPAPPSGGKPARDSGGGPERDYVTRGGADSSFLRDVDEIEPRTAGRAIAAAAVTPERPASRSLFADEADGAVLATNEDQRPVALSSPSRDEDSLLADGGDDFEGGQGRASGAQVFEDKDNGDGTVPADGRLPGGADDGGTHSAGSGESKPSVGADGTAAAESERPSVVTPERHHSDDPELAVYASESSLSEISLTDDDKDVEPIAIETGPPAYVPPKAPILSIPSHDSGSSSADELSRIIAGVTAERKKRATSGKMTPMTKRRRRRRGRDHAGGDGGSDASAGSLLDEVIVEEGELNTSGEPCRAEEGSAARPGGFLPGDGEGSMPSRSRRGRTSSESSRAQDGDPHDGLYGDPYGDPFNDPRRPKSPAAPPAQITVSAVLGRRAGGLADDPDAVVRSEARGNLAADVGRGGSGSPDGGGDGSAAPSSAAWRARRNRMARLRMRRAGKAGRPAEDGGILRAGEDVAIDCDSDEDSI